ENELRTIFSHEDATKIFGGPRHRDICSMTPGGQVLSMIGAEVNSYATRFGVLAAEFDLARQLFAGGFSCLAPDTTFFIEHIDKIENVDLHVLAEDPGSVKILIPMVVI